MMNKISTRNHYIPQFLTRNWADKSGQVWVYNKQDDRIFKTSPQNVFVKKHLYTVQDVLDSSRSDQFERQFAHLEAKVSKSISRLVKSARRRYDPQLSSHELLDCKRFLLSMLRRTPESQANVRNPEDVFHIAVKTLPEAANFGLDDAKVLYSIPGIREMKRVMESNSTAKYAAGQVPGHQKEVERIASTTGLQARVISNPKRSFLLGSYGYCFMNDRTQDGKRVKDILVPVAPDVILACAEKPYHTLVKYIEDKEKHRNFINRINESVVSLSGYIVAKDKRLLEAWRKKVLKGMKI